MVLATSPTEHLESLELHRPIPELLSYGFHAVINAIYDFERHRNHALAQEKSRGWWREKGVPFLAAVPDEVLSGIVYGRLMHFTHSNVVM